MFCLLASFRWLQLYLGTNMHNLFLE
uniref:Uncharacterized protein n=1 Tax=Arundo donax TaxID=35708 RepID=A0A0A9EBB1_ARUDO